MAIEEIGNAANGVECSDLRSKTNEIIGVVNGGPGGDAAQFSTAMAAYLAALPTADPLDGSAWLNNGALTLGTPA